MPNRQLINGEPYRYAYQGQEKDTETGKEAFQLRTYDARIGRWLSPDPLGKGDSPYTGMYNNPLKYIDQNGADTLNVYRSQLLKLKTYGDSYGNELDYGVYKLNFEIIKNGKRLKQKLVLYMYTNHKYEEANSLENKPIHDLYFTQMAENHNNEIGWENTIWIGGTGTFIHPGDPIANTGCKAIFKTSDFPFKPSTYSETFPSTQENLQSIRDLYNTTDKQGFFLITGFKPPVVALPKLKTLPIRKGRMIMGEPLLEFPKIDQQNN